jgi:membrane-bound lytic murein transglycosylase MltF
MQVSGLGAALAAAMVFATTSATAQQPGARAPAGSQARHLSVPASAWKGDLDGMIERRMIRVRVPYSRTLYYNDRGRERGLSAEVARDFERHINQKYAKEIGKRPVTVYLIPTTRRELIEDVADGLGDVAAGSLTVTEERLKHVDFVVPEDRPPMAEVVVSRRGSPVASAEALSGRTVHVRKSSSYYESLEALNARLRHAGKAPVKLVPVPEELGDEDLMEMLNAGLIQTTIIDDWLARMWAQVLPEILVNPDASLRDGGRIGWAIRKESPKLRAELEAFFRDVEKRQGRYAALLKREMARVRQISNSAGDSEIKRFEDTIALFRRYGDKYNFDPLMLAAQGYQESQLDQNARSPVGAIGVMQLMPATGQELKVGDIRAIEPNIHGGAKYMDKLMTQYFRDASFAPDVRPLFAFASYNAGPGAIARMRKEAEKRGLDPNRWFGHVEIVTAEKIGIETTTYVRNIYKYYVSYRLIADNAEEQRKARERVTGGGTR